MRYFTDERYPDERIPETQIMREYGRKVAEGDLDPFEITYPQYLRNRMTGAGGTLSEALPEKDAVGKFTFLIRETQTLRVTVEAESFEKAQVEVEQGYDTGEYNLDRNCFAGVEYRPCCSECESDFDSDGDGLCEVNDGTALAMLLCDRCAVDMVDRGSLMRCDSCGNVFSPSRMIINLENGERKICPECGEVWCD